MSQIDDVVAKIEADISGYIAAMNTAKNSTKSSTSEMGDSFKSCGEMLDIYVTAPLLAMGYEAVKAFNDASINAAAMGAQLKATGNAVGFTADQLDKMAQNLSITSGIGKEDILAGVTDSLLKFSNISGDTFSRAQKDILDVASAMKMSLPEATNIVGRSLDYPAQALTFLKRAHIDMLPAQQQVIQNMLDAGHVSQAQATILEFLEGKFKNTASSMRQLPVRQISSDMALFKDDVLQPMGGIVEKALVPLFNVVGNLAKAFSNLSPTAKEVITMFLAITAAVGPLMTGVGVFVTKILPELRAGFSVLIGVVDLLNGAFITLVADILPIVVAIGAVVLAGKSLYDNWNALKDVGSAAWSFIKSIIETSVAGILTALEKIPGMGNKFESTIKSMRDNAKKNMDDVHDSMNNASDDSVSLGDSIKDLGDTAGNVFDKIKKLAGGMTGSVKQDFQDIGKIGKTLPAQIVPEWETAFNKVESLGKVATDQLQGAFEGLAQGITDSLSNGAADWQQIIGNIAQTMLKAFIDWGVHALMVILGVANGINAVQSFPPLVAIAVIAGLIAITAALHTAPKMAKGGVFDRATTVTVGEAGPEVILPVTRLSNGNMGVAMQASGGGDIAGASSMAGPNNAAPGAASGDIGLHVVVNLDSNPILKAVTRASRLGKVIIHPSAVRVVALNP